MKVVHVQWLDSETRNGWESLDDIKAYEPNMLAHSVGFLLREGDGFIAIAHSYDFENSHYNGLMIIPKLAIKKMMEIYDLSICDEF